jgi:hypothetical protein
LYDLERHATPDFVIEGGVKIAGKKVYWIDAKSYFGSDMDSVRVPLIRQSEKYEFVYYFNFVWKLTFATIRYNEVFGPGAVVFALGFTQSLASGTWSICAVSVLFTYLLSSIIGCNFS